MVEDGGDALLDAVDDQRLGGGFRGFQVQVPVNGPPGTVQHLVEVGGVIAHNGKAPGQRGVDVGVGVDEAGHDDAAPGVHEFRLRVLGFQVGGGTHFHDLAAVGDDAAVAQVAGAVRVPGDNFSVCQYDHTKNLLECLNLKNKKGASNHLWFETPIKKRRNDRCQPVRAALRFSYHSLLVLVL